VAQCVALGLSVDELMRRAREISGIDFIDHDAVEPLTVLCRSLDGESCLHEQGAMEMRRKLLRILANRLRMQRDLAAHPEILEQTITAPVIVCGMPRTGSTKTQRFLAASGDFNWLPFWQSRNPASLTGVPNESTTQRIQDTEEYVRWFDKASPEAKSGHEFSTLGPAEESWILEHSLRTLVFQGWSAVWSYLEWLLQTQAITAQFSFLRDALKYLQWQGLHDKSKRWVLKCPLYVGLEESLLSVFPDACLIMTHRSPLQTAPSICKLSNVFYIPHTNKLTDCDTAINGFAQQMQGHLNYRKSHPETRFLDIYYEDLIFKEAEAIERIYSFCGIPLSETSKKNISDWSRKNPKNKLGAFSYSLAEFNLSADKVSAQFEEYNSFLASFIYASPTHSIR
jgi:Sulfotransferase family